MIGQIGGNLPDGMSRCDFFMAWEDEHYVVYARPVFGQEKLAWSIVRCYDGAYSTEEAWREWLLDREYVINGWKNWGTKDTL